MSTQRTLKHALFVGFSRHLKKNFRLLAQCLSGFRDFLHRFSKKKLATTGSLHILENIKGTTPTKTHHSPQGRNPHNKHL
jgi:hypothetical protein